MDKEIPVREVHSMHSKHLRLCTFINGFESLCRLGLEASGLGRHCCLKRDRDQGSGTEARQGGKRIRQIRYVYSSTASIVFGPIWSDTGSATEPSLEEAESCAKVKVTSSGQQGIRR